MDFKTALLSGHFADQVMEVVKGEAMNNKETLLSILRPLMDVHSDREKFYVFYLDAKNQIIELKVEGIGSILSCAVYPRELIKKGLKLNCASLILAHNHPSGDTEPSREDRKITKTIIMASQIMGMTVHEHIIIGNKTKDYFSFAEEGLIQQYDFEIKEFVQSGL